MKVNIKNLLVICTLLAFMIGCKPTEKGYKTAYDAAKSKREQVDPDEALLTGGHKLLDESSSNWKVLGKDTLQLQHLLLRPMEDSQWPQSGPYRLAVAMFKMNTNAKSMLKDLSGKGSLKPIIASDGKDRLYIIAGSATYADSLAQVLSTFRREHPDFQFIGLTPPQPIILVGR